MVEGGGFEPPKAEPADLQSAPFDRSGTPPAEQTADFGLIFNVLSTSSQDKSALALLVIGNAPNWSPQRESNPRPTDSHPPPLSRPPLSPEVWGPDFLFTISPTITPPPTQVGGVKSLHSPRKRQNLNAPRRSTGLPSQHTNTPGIKEGFPVLATSTPRVSPQRCNHSQISRSAS